MNERQTLNRMQTPPAVTEVIINEEILGFHLEDGRDISVPLAFYPTLALATPEERARFEMHGSSVYWPDLDVDLGAEGLLAGRANTTCTLARPSSAPCGSDVFLPAPWNPPRLPICGQFERSRSGSPSNHPEGRTFNPKSEVRGARPPRA